MKLIDVIEPREISNRWDLKLQMTPRLISKVKHEKMRNHCAFHRPR